MLIRGSASRKSACTLRCAPPSSETEAVTGAPYVALSKLTLYTPGGSFSSRTGVVSARLRPAPRTNTFAAGSDVKRSALFAARRADDSGFAELARAGFTGGSAGALAIGRGGVEDWTGAGSSLSVLAGGRAEALAVSPVSRP